ncbi:MAG: type II toxin-antitoxin system RelE/ParE family toxin [Dehalococcoidia bacterium]|nr:type II toxin-antitoxin system RelE/ParE family toxin [Dehalococcoidia bacterium]
MVGYRIEVTTKAKLDMRGIHEYVAHVLCEPNIADRLLDKIETRILTLRNLPFKHAPARNEHARIRDLRKLVVDNYFVFYAIDEMHKTIYIVRVLYGRMDWLNII